MSKHRKRRDSAPKPSGSSFRVVVAAAPTGLVTIAPELELAKAALVYGDSVTVLSPVTTMLLRVADFGSFDLRSQVRLVQKTAPYLMPPDEGTQLASGLDAVLASLNKRAGSLTQNDVILRGTMAAQLAPLQAECATVADRILEDSGFKQLARARAEGLVDFENCDAGANLDLIASCIIKAKLVEGGQAMEDLPDDGVIESFVERLSTYLSSGRDYLAFDEQVASLVDSAIGAGIMQPTQGPMSRSAQVMSASGLMAHLPTFPNATTDEVIDIRAELAEPLTSFRAAMVSASRAFTSKPWDASFADELHDYWVETVAPAVADIESAVRDNRSVLNLAAGIAGAAKEAWPGLVVVGAGMAGHVPALQIAGGVISAASPVLKTALDLGLENRKIRQRPFYLLYRVEEATGR
jgi:hypothetical protein